MKSKDAGIANFKGWIFGFLPSYIAYYVSNSNYYLLLCLCIIKNIRHIDSPIYIVRTYING